MKKLHRVRTLKNDTAEIMSVSNAVLGRMHREVIFTRHSIAIIIHFSLKTEKKIIRTTDTYLCLSVSSLWTNLASSRMCDWNRHSLPLFGGRSKLYHPCTDEGSLPEIVQYGPSARFQCFTASKGSNNYFYSSVLEHLLWLYSHSCK